MSDAELFDKTAERVEDEIRDIWPSLKGADILLFQNDLFYKIRQLETKCEGGTARGFLPAAFEELHSVPDWSGGEVYEGAWAELIELCKPEVLAELDVFEEYVCDWIEDMIPAELNFFEAALEQGVLNAEWLEKAAEQLQKGSAAAAHSSGALEIDAREQIPEIKEVDLTRLAYTRRRVSRPFEFSRSSKPSLRKTRRKSPI